MKRILILGLVLSLLIMGGCDDSHSSCMYDCKTIKSQDYCKSLNQTEYRDCTIFRYGCCIDTKYPDTKRECFDICVK